MPRGGYDGAGNWDPWMSPGIMPPVYKQPNGTPHHQVPWAHGGAGQPTGPYYGDDMGMPVPVPMPAVPTLPVVDPVTGLTTTPVTTVASGFDLSSIMSGTIFGLPSWLVIAGGVWFFFLRKH